MLGYLLTRPGELEIELERMTTCESRNLIYIKTIWISVFDLESHISHPNYIFHYTDTYTAKETKLYIVS